MLRIICVLVAGLAFSTCFANSDLEPLLNKVTVQFNAEQWITSKTALVNISVNASVNDHSVEKINSQVLGKLNQLAKADWHLISYDRTQDKSGLESITIVGQARLPEPELAGLRDKAKNISKPGETYTIDSIQFTPSEDEFREGNNILRENIYQQINNEIARLNKAYPNQKYYVHSVNFGFVGEPMPMQNMMLAKVEGGAAAPRAAMQVGDKSRLSATVVLASNPDPMLIKP